MMTPVVTPPKKKTPRWVWWVGFFALIGAVVTLWPKQDKSDPNPTGGTELCQMIRDPHNINFDASDYRRMSGFNEQQLVDYVIDHCPDQLQSVKD